MRRLAAQIRVMISSVFMSANNFSATKLVCEKLLCKFSLVYLQIEWSISK